MKILKRILLALSGLLFLLILGVWIFSFYKYDPGLKTNSICYTIEIQAHADSVYTFLGNSANATKWSVYVDHISTLNADSIADGKPGSQRRCFCESDESGSTWDETITEVVPGKKRQLICYNFKDFPLTATGLTTEQQYENQENGSCRITFSLYVNSTSSLIDRMKMYMASFTVHRIFRKNMENIKAICEGRPAPNPHE